jgi:hypothetical protein
MSRLEALDLGALRVRLIVALTENELPGSLYLQSVAALLLACDPASPGELGMLDSIVHQQCAAEAVDADELLDALGTVTEVLS